MNSSLITGQNIKKFVINSFVLYMNKN